MSPGAPHDSGVAPPGARSDWPTGSGIGAVLVRFLGADRHPVLVSSLQVTGSSWEVGHACTE